MPRIVYVSCDAASFARDAAILARAGFVPGAVTPIDQFLFSGHIELVAGFVREPKRA
jgi:23S rRNA (uracil1939-C5)-methyltransferase